MKKKFAVLGNPIRHSWSPFIHELFAKQFDLSISYIKVKVLSGSLNNTLQELIKQGFTGVNITVPLKKEAFDFASSNKCEITVRAKKANAVNTIFFDKQKFIADNTDGYGLIKSLEGFNLKKIKGGSILICGAGGATRGILPVFNKNNFKKITIINRSHTNLNMLSSIFSSNLFDYITIKDFKNNFSTLSKTEKRMFNYNLIINATSASIADSDFEHIPSEIFNDCPLALDLFYGKTHSPFMKLALASGAKNVLDGLGMLVEQAAESFYIWTGFKPKTSQVLNTLRFEILKK